VLEHPPGHSGALTARPRWKGRPEIVNRETTMPAIDGVKHATEKGTREQDAAHRQQPDDADDCGDGGMLETVTERDRLISQ
jgi:hypothetical protein